MNTDESFKDFVLDQLGGIPDLHSRKMFGGYGLYSSDTFFGIMSDDVLYFKTNEKTRERYLAQGSDCFKPSEKQILKNYYEVPADILENHDELLEWADEAITVAQAKH